MFSHPLTQLVLLFVVLSLSSCARPPPSHRKFVSAVIDSTISDIKNRMKDPVLADIFESCLPNTLDTTVSSQHSYFLLTFSFSPRFSHSPLMVAGSQTVSSSQATLMQCGSGTALTKLDFKLHSMI
jgi:hypothetical protein